MSSVSSDPKTMISVVSTACWLDQYDVHTRIPSVLQDDIPIGGAFALLL